LEPLPPCKLPRALARAVWNSPAASPSEKRRSTCRARSLCVCALFAGISQLYPLWKVRHCVLAPRSADFEAHPGTRTFRRNGSRMQKQLFSARESNGGSALSASVADSDVSAVCAVDRLARSLSQERAQSKPKIHHVQEPAHSKQLLLLSSLQVVYESAVTLACFHEALWVIQTADVQGRFTIRPFTFESRQPGANPGGRPRTYGDGSDGDRIETAEVERRHEELPAVLPFLRSRRTESPVRWKGSSGHTSIE
jgi:hypothetical protein